MQQEDEEENDSKVKVQVYYYDAQHRRRELGKIFEIFDMDSSSKIESTEIFVLAQARRALGHRDGGWSMEDNERTVGMMDRNRDGQISKSEFLDYFEHKLPSEKPAFDFVINQFKEVRSRIRIRIRCFFPES